MKRLLSVLVLLALVPQTAFAATSYEVHNVPPMRLYATITSTATTNIRISPPERVNETLTFPTTSGGVVRIRDGIKWEDIYYASASVNSTTKVITLSGVIRDLCFNVARQYTGCNGGYGFAKGAIVEENVDARLINLKVNMDRTNTLTASGALKFSGSGSLNIPSFATEAERDRQMGSSFTGVRTACVTGTGSCYYKIGGAWIKFGSGSIVNAREDVAGKVQLATVTQIKNRTQTGSTNAQLVLQPQHVTASGGTQFDGFVPRLDGAYLSGSLLGSGSRNSLTYLAGDQTYKTVIPGSGANLVANVALQNAGPFSTTSNVFADIDSTVTASVSVSVGDLLMINLKGVWDNTNIDTENSLDFRVNGGRLGIIDGGANGNSIGLFNDQFEVAGRNEGVNVTHWHKAQTGGLVIVRPMWKTSSNTATWVQNYPLYFQVVKFEKR